MAYPQGKGRQTMRFARSLAKLRKDKKVSQRTAAAALGVSQALLSHYENGLREPGLEFLVNAGKYYGCSVDRLLGLEPLPTETMPVSAVAAAKAVTEFAAAQDEALGELAEDYLLLASYRLMQLIVGGGTGALLASNAALTADELAICAVGQAGGTPTTAMAQLEEKMAERLRAKR